MELMTPTSIPTRIAEVRRTFENCDVLNKQDLQSFDAGDISALNGMVRRTYLTLVSFTRTFCKEAEARELVENTFRQSIAWGFRQGDRPLMHCLLWRAVQVSRGRSPRWGSILTMFSIWWWRWIIVDLFIPWTSPDATFRWLREVACLTREETAFVLGVKVREVDRRHADAAYSTVTMGEREGDSCHSIREMIPGVVADGDSSFPEHDHIISCQSCRTLYHTMFELRLEPMPPIESPATGVCRAENLKSNARHDLLIWIPAFIFAVSLLAIRLWDWLT